MNCWNVGQLAAWMPNERSYAAVPKSTSEQAVCCLWLGFVMV